MNGLDKETLEALKPGCTERPAIPPGMFASAISREDARTLLNGLFPAGVDVGALSPQAKEEIRKAIEVVLKGTADRS